MTNRPRPTTLVIGGTGKTGRRVAQRLRTLGAAVRIGSRSGAPPVDWNHPATCDGVARVVTRDAAAAGAWA